MARTKSCHLSPPGFSKATTSAGLFAKDHFNDASKFIDGSIQLKVRSSTPGYKGFKLEFAAEGVPGRRFGSGSFKGDFEVDGADWQVVSMPFNSFSYDWSDFTGECSTTDPNGDKHKCCSKVHPEVCPTATFLSKITALSVWAEGVAGDFQIEVQWIGAGPKTVVAQSAADDEPVRPPTQYDTCSAPVQSNLRYNISTLDGSYITAPVPDLGKENLATAICCDNRTKVFAEPRFLFESPQINLFAQLDANKVTTFYDSVCGLPLFRAPVNRTLADFQADTVEHGWPSFRPAEVITENVITDPDSEFVYSKCGTHLGSYLPDAKGPRWCMDLSCVSGNQK